MAPDALHEELVRVLGSRREASWVLQEAADRDGDPSLAAREMARRRADGEPLQYVLGHWPFRELDLLVDRRALIPRPETEVLVGLALDRLSERATGSVPAVVVDLGCGTGAIALSLAVEAPARGVAVEVHATDVSTAALELAARNAERVGAASSVRFASGSWYDALDASLRGRLSLVCANPPYVAARERTGLARELDFEPELALVAADGPEGTPGFAGVAAVLADARAWLAPGGVLLVEHGEAHRDAALALALDAGLTEVRDHEDLGGRPRVLEAHRSR